MAEAVVRLRVDASGATRALNGVQTQTNKLQNSFQHGGISLEEMLIPVLKMKGISK